MDVSNQLGALITQRLTPESLSSLSVDKGKISLNGRLLTIWNTVLKSNTSEKLNTCLNEQLKSIDTTALGDEELTNLVSNVALIRGKITTTPDVSRLYEAQLRRLAQRLTDSKYLLKDGRPDHDKMAQVAQDLQTLKQAMGQSYKPPRIEIDATSDLGLGSIQKWLRGLEGSELLTYKFNYPAPFSWNEIQPERLKERVMKLATTDTIWDEELKILADHFKQLKTIKKESFKAPHLTMPKENQNTKLESWLKEQQNKGLLTYSYDRQTEEEKTGNTKREH